MAAPGQTRLLCFALQAVLQFCGSIEQGCASRSRWERDGGSEADEREQLEIGGDC